MSPLFNTYHVIFNKSGCILDDNTFISPAEFMTGISAASSKDKTEGKHKHQRKDMHQKYREENVE